MTINRCINRFLQFLPLIACVSLTPFVLVGENDTRTKEPSVFTEGLGTILIPGGAEIWQHIRWERDEYKEHPEYAYFVEMNKIPVFQVNKDGSMEKIMTLGDVRYSLHGKKYPNNLDEDLYIQGYRDKMQFGVMQALMQHNHAVKCPAVVPEYSFIEKYAWWTKKNAGVPLAIVVGKPTPDCPDVCEKIKQYYVAEKV